MQGPALCDGGAVVVAGVLWVHRALANELRASCGPSVAKLERVGVVMMTTVITGIPRFGRNEEGRTKEQSCPKKTDSKRASFQRRQISTGQKFWNELE